MHETVPPDPFKVSGIPGIIIAGICIFYASAYLWCGDNSLSTAHAVIYGSATIFVGVYPALIVSLFMRTRALTHLLGAVTMTSFMSFTVAGMFY